MRRAFGAVVIGTRPEIAEETIRECAELGIKHVWMHRGPGAGSVSKPAADDGRRQGITVIDGGARACSTPPPTSDIAGLVTKGVTRPHAAGNE
jgi:uncharacterized protein